MGMHQAADYFACKCSCRSCRLCDLQLAASILRNRDHSHLPATMYSRGIKQVQCAGLHQQQKQPRHQHSLQQRILWCLKCRCCVGLQHLLPEVTKRLEGKIVLVTNAVPSVNVPVDLAVAGIEAICGCASECYNRAPPLTESQRFGRGELQQDNTSHHVVLPSRRLYVAQHD